MERTHFKKQNEEFQARVISLILQTYCDNENRGIMKNKLQLGKGILLPFLDCKQKILAK